MSRVKFLNSTDKYLLLSELGLTDKFDNSLDISEEISEMFIKKRKSMIPKFKNFRKSQVAKHLWRTSRWKYMKGIKKFHRSIAGKRFHRSLGRFLASRITRPKNESSLELYKELALKSISSIKTHMYIEQAYYCSIDEQVDYELFIDYAVPILSAIELKLFEDISSELSEDELELLYRLVDIDEFNKSLIELSYSDNLSKSFMSELEIADLDSTYTFCNILNKLTTGSTSSVDDCQEGK